MLKLLPVAAPEGKGESCCVGGKSMGKISTGCRSGASYSLFGSGCSLHPPNTGRNSEEFLTSFPNKKVLWRSWCSPSVKPLPFLWLFNSCQDTRAEFQKSTSFSASSSFPVANRNPCLIPHVCLSYRLNLVIHRGNRVRETLAFKQKPFKWAVCRRTFLRKLVHFQYDLS